MLKSYFIQGQDTGAWCNGSTPDFESVDLGSTPSAPAFIDKKLHPNRMEFCFLEMIWRLSDIFCIEIHHALNEKRIVLAKPDEGVRCILVKEAFMLFARGFQLGAETG